MSNLRELARQALVAKVQSLKSTFTDYPLEVEFANGQKVNTATQATPYLRVALVYQDGMQIDLALEPEHRLMGVILVEAYVKEGAGTRQANELLAHFYPGLHMQASIGPIRTRAARFTSKPPVEGWVAEAAVVPFWVDSIGH